METVAVVILNGKELKICKIDERMFDEQFRKANYRETWDFPETPTGQKVMPGHKFAIIVNQVFVHFI